MSSKKNVFVIGLDDFNHQYLNTITNAQNYAFHPLLSFEEVVPGPEFDIPRLFQKAERSLNHFKGSIDAIVSYWDFPAVLMMPILRSKYKLTGRARASKSKTLTLFLYIHHKVLLFVVFSVLKSLNPIPFLLNLELNAA